MPKKGERKNTAKRHLVRCLGIDSKKREHSFMAVKGGGNRTCPACEKKAEAMLLRDIVVYHDYRED